MKVLITGATGLIGKVIVKHCHNNDIAVHYLTTSKEKIETTDNYKGYYWNPKASIIDTNCFSGVEVIINLVGSSISKRWTRAYKKEIIKSRTQSLQLLKDTIIKEKLAIKQIISASAIGIYPDSLTNYYDESYSKKSSSFLGDVVTQWETAVDTFSELKINIAKIRIGIVLAKDGGALPQMIKPIQYGLGATFGKGNQWQSWIHINDLAQFFIFILKYNLTGIYNAVAPNAVTNLEFTKTLATRLEKPLILPNIPKVFMKLILGEMHILLFESQRVCSKKTEDLGFNFQYHHLQIALNDIIGETPF